MTSPSKRLTTITALVVALTLLLAGCGGGSEADEEDLGTLSVMLPLLEAQAPAADGRIHQAIEEFIGKQLEVSWVPNSNYQDRTNVTLASDSLPEVMVVQDNKLPSFVRSAEAGAFWDLTDRLDNYPNLVAENEQTLRNSSVNGTVYGLFRGRDPMRVAVVLREDWLANLGLQPPETVDDLYSIAKAFTEQDPDGNGQDDTYGLVLPQWPGGGYASASPYDVIETWFGAPNGWGERDGQLVPGFSTPEFLEANQFVKRMVEEGLVNPDFATLNADGWNDPFFNGQGGIIVDVSSRAGVITELFKEQDPENYGDYVTMAGNLTGPDGERHAYPTVGYNGLLAIPKQSVPSEEELDDVLTVLDKMSSKEGQILLNNGVEDENFTVTDTEEGGEELPGPGIGYASPIEDDAEAEVMHNDVRAYAQMGTSINGYLAYDLLPADEPEREFWNHRWEIHDRDAETAVHNLALPLISETQTARGAQIDRIIGDARVKYYAGQLDDNGLKAEIQRWYEEGGQQIVEELNEQYAEMTG